MRSKDSFTKGREVLQKAIGISDVEYLADGADSIVYEYSDARKWVAKIWYDHLERSDINAYAEMQNAFAKWLVRNCDDVGCVALPDSMEVENDNSCFLVTKSIECVEGGRLFTRQQIMRVNELYRDFAIENSLYSDWSIETVNMKQSATGKIIVTDIAGAVIVYLGRNGVGDPDVNYKKYLKSVFGRGLR
jgi:hypothetical protein